MKFPFLRKFGLALACTAFFVACGDDDGKKESISEVPIDSYDSLEDLPVCVDSLYAKVAQVKDSYYACLSEEWQKIGGLVKGVCNLDVCDDDLDGDYYYVKNSRKLFSCSAESWKDLDNKGISENEYVDCVVDALTKETASDTADLKKCNAAHEGELASVKKDLYACSSKKWVLLKDQVVSEGDLPACKTNGEYVFVLSRMSAFQCRDGEWSNGATEVSSSSEVQETSSSSAQKTPSSSSIAPTTNDSTKVRGLCMPSENYAEKGDEISWKFINLGGTPVTLSWEFTDGASKLESAWKSPKISYSRGGSHGAKLVVNKGLPSESDEIICTKVLIPGTPISGCKCTTEETAGSASAERPFSALWTVSGCQGAAPFTYEWYSAEGSDSAALGSTTNIGKFAPSVVVTNYDGESMSPTCKSIDVVEKTTATCEYSEYQGFQVKLNSYPRDSYGAPLSRHFEMQVIGDDLDEPMDVEIDPYYGLVSLMPTRDRYHEYYLTYLGDTVCTMSTPVSCEATVSELQKEHSSSWSVQGLTGYGVKSYLWTFTDADGNEFTSDKAHPNNDFNVYGSVSATLVVNQGLSNEKKLSCRGLEVVPPPIDNCTCEPVELISTSDDVANVSIVSYKWKVDNCVTEGGALSYEWSDDLYVISLPYTKYVPESSSSEVIEESSSSEEPVESSSSSSVIPSSSSVIPSEEEESSSSEEIIDISSSSIEEPLAESSSSEDVVESSSAVIPSEEDIESSGSSIPYEFLSSSEEESSSSEEIIDISSSSIEEPLAESSSSEDVAESSSSVIPSSSSDDIPAIQPAPKSVSGANAVYEMDSIGLYSPTLKVSNAEGRVQTLTCRVAPVKDSNSPYTFVKLARGTILTTGLYVINDCDGSNKNIYWYSGDFTSYSQENWFRRGFVDMVRYENMVRVNYPVVLEVPEGESLSINKCVEEEE